MEQIRTIGDVVDALKVIGVEGPAVAADVLAAVGGFTLEERDEILRRMSQVGRSTDPGE